MMATVILANTTSRTQHVQNIVNLVMSNGFDGIDLDYEGFAFTDGRESWPTTQPVWVAFVTELAAALHANGKLLSVTIPPTWMDQVWSAAIPCTTPQQIGAVADRIRLMVYDWSVSSPGPISPMSWVNLVIAYNDPIVPNHKLQLGIPAYGRDWGRQRQAARSAPTAHSTTRSIELENMQGVIDAHGAPTVIRAQLGRGVLHVRRRRDRVQHDADPGPAVRAAATRGAQRSSTRLRPTRSAAGAPTDAADRSTVVHGSPLRVLPGRDHDPDARPGGARMPDGLAWCCGRRATRRPRSTRRLPTRRRKFVDRSSADIVSERSASHGRVVHRRRSPDADRQDERSARFVQRRRSRWAGDQGRPRASRRRARGGRARADGPGADGRPGPGAVAAGGRQGRHPDERAERQHQQGLPVGAQHDLPRRPDDRRRRGRHRHRRWHGEHDQRAVPRRRCARRLPLRQHRARRRDHHGRSVVRVRRLPDGSRHRALLAPAASRASSRTRSR